MGIDQPARGDVTREQEKERRDMLKMISGQLESLRVDVKKMSGMEHSKLEEHLKRQEEKLKRMEEAYRDFEKTGDNKLLIL